MEKSQINQIAENNNGSTLLSILLHRLELMGLFKSFMVRTSLGRCSSMARSHFAFQPFSTVSLALASVLALAFSFSFFFYLIMPSNVSAASNLTVTVANTISLDIMPNSASGTFAHSSTSANTVTPL